MKNNEKFITQWKTISEKGKRKYLVRNGILKSIFIWNTIILLFMKMIHGRNFSERVFNNSTMGKLILCSTVVGVIGYYVSKSMWKRNCHKYMQMQLEQLMISREKNLAIKE